MAVNGTNPYSSVMRITGLGTSGLDTEAMVNQLMKAERVPLDRLNQKMQLSIWKRDAYRDITNLLRGLKDDYFNVLKPANNMLSPSAYKKYTTTSTDSTVVNITANADAIAGSHTVAVNQIATAAITQSSSALAKQIHASNPVNFSAAQGQNFVINVDGVLKTVTIGADTGVLANNITNLQASIDNAVGKTALGTSKVVVADDGTGRLTFTAAAGSGVSRVTLSAGSLNALPNLGFINTDILTNRLNPGDTLQTIASKLGTAAPFTADGNGKVNITVNGKAFQFNWTTTTLAGMMSQISADSTANVIMQYDEVSDTIKFTSKQLGAGANIQLSESGSTFLSAFNLSTPTVTAGKDANITLDGTQTIVRSSNSFTVNGINFTLLKNSPTVQTVTITQDVNSVFDSIKKFVDKYNDVINTINTKLTEKYDRNYQPLTDDQKSAMKDDDIKKWEEKAKTGLLRNDDLLQGAVYGMRQALYDQVSGITTSLTNIGITTGSYQDKGKLIIDETKLKAAIQNNPDAVMNLFTKQSSITSNVNITPSQRTQRYNEEGLAYRLSDILDNYAGTYGSKGLLLQKAGLTGDVTEFTSSMSREISGYSNEINDMNQKLIDKENSYYQKFSHLDTIITQMNSQISWISSQLGGQSR